ncbi:hypothetical protein ONZ51_g11591 [Trametes cubensis]|uniref:Clathrin/coatomer adaptor adaptin-like N-terminal domain-containing protein n=1 Tax=Trametes cubensis TaxID=1111947 RepID=A0AAD7THP6_9APHY|nr:hypothetical protein ONZ51_g11591 [Trametes cubensis]
MAALNLNMLTENASRLGMRLQETLSEHTRDLAIARGTGSAYLDNPEEKVKNIAKQLDSNSDREKLEAMKRLIALISRGRNVSEFFAQVVKNVASHNLEIRKLVYIYLLRYAEQEPDLALLSINTFQKDLSDPNPLIRAMALRVLSGIKVPMIGSIVVLAIKKCAADISPYVRKAAALAIPKIYHLDSTHQPELINIICTLLKDQSPLSIGSVAVAFEAVCPTRLDLLHQHYRRLCRTLIDVDEWGQVDLLNLLIRYARVMLPRPIPSNESGSNTQFEVDNDLRLLLTSAEPLFQSQNPAVVLAVARVFYYPAEAFKTFVINAQQNVVASSGGQTTVHAERRYAAAYAHSSRTLQRRPASGRSHCTARTYNRSKPDALRLAINLRARVHLVRERNLLEVVRAQQPDLVQHPGERDAAYAPREKLRTQTRSHRSSPSASASRGYHMRHLQRPVSTLVMRDVRDGAMLL